MTNISKKLNKEEKDVKLSPQDLALITAGKEALQKALQLSKSTEWKFKRRKDNGDILYSLRGPDGNKIYKVVGIIPANPEILFKETFENYDKMPIWNTSLATCKIIQKSVDTNTDVIYAASTIPEWTKYLGSARDFVNVRYRQKVEDCLYLQVNQ